MSGLSNQSETDFLNHNFIPGAGAYSPPSTHWISLHDGDPADVGSNEITGGSYARFEMSAPATDWGAASGREIANVTPVLFAGMPAVTVTHMGIWSASTAGTFMAGQALSSSKVVSAGATARFLANQLKVLFSAGVFTDYLVHAWLNFQFRLVSYTRPSGHNLLIYDGDPTGAGTPVNGSSPQSIAFNAPGTVGTRQQVTNNGVISFASLLNDNLSYWLVRDTEGSPNQLAYRNQATFAVNNGDTVQFADTDIEVGVD